MKDTVITRASEAIHRKPIELDDFIATLPQKVQDAIEKRFKELMQEELQRQKMEQQ